MAEVRIPPTDPYPTTQPCSEPRNLQAAKGALLVDVPALVRVGDDDAHRGNLVAHRVRLVPLPVVAQPRPALQQPGDRLDVDVGRIALVPRVRQREVRRGKPSKTRLGLSSGVAAREAAHSRGSSQQRQARDSHHLDVPTSIVGARLKLYVDCCIRNSKKHSRHVFF